MDQIALDAFDDETRRALFRALHIDEALLQDLGGFESFVFARHDRDSILRITHTSHRSIGQVMAELDWIDFLARNGAAVSTPVRQAGGALALPWRDFVICEFTRARGRTITADDWGAALFEEWGKGIGEFHRLTRQYAVPESGERRPDCTEDDNFDLEGLVPHDQPGVLAMAQKYHERFMAQPRSDTDFGLIHSDPHAGNFFIDGGKLTFFDFDDSCYCWFAYDVATLLLSAVLQPWIEESQAGRETAAREFLPPFLNGYASANDVPASLVANLQLGLKFREICLYGVITKFLPEAEWDWYAKRFMAGRRERIENDEAYLSLDFA